VRPQTRVIAVTWVHSSTGLKIPVGRIADALKAVNARRSEEDRALLCVDGVHGFGVRTLPPPTWVATFSSPDVTSGCLVLAEPV